MDVRKLRELDRDEAVRTLQIAANVRNNLQQNRPVAARDLYPELKLEEPYSYCLGTIQPTEILPFVKTLIVDLKLVRTPDEFLDRYGLTVRRFRELVERGRIALRIRDKYVKFAGLDYLDELIQTRPPASVRYVGQFQEEHQQYLEFGRKLFQGKRPRGQRWRSEYRDWETRPSFSEVFAHKFALVACYFGQHYAENIVARAMEAGGDPAVAYDFLHLFSRYRVYPHMNFLDGLSILRRDDISMIPHGITLQESELRPPSTVVPYEVGRALVMNLPLRMPEDLDKVLSIEPAEWLSAVAELDKALERGIPGEIRTYSEKITHIAHQARDEVQRMMSTRSRVRAAVVGVFGTIGITGMLSEFAPPEWKPIIGGASGGAVMLESKIADTVVKLRKRGHVVAWFDIAKKLA